jgi:hypothetical protein
MTNKILYENAINNCFNTLYNPGETLSLVVDNRNLDWVRCARMGKGIAILIETDSVRSQFKRNFKGAHRIVKGAIKLEEMNIEVDGGMCSFITVQCPKEKLFKIFVRLAADLIMHLEDNFKSITSPWDILRDRIEGWKLLFKFHDNKAEEKGLIGELILYKLLIENIDLIPQNWTGPIGGTKDFMINNFNFEVKTTTVRYGYFVEINGLYQTKITDQIDKLVFIRLEETPNGNISIKTLIELIKEKMTPSDNIYFNSLLSEFGEDLLNSDNKYTLLELVIFDIDDKFPKITEQSFINNKLPNGVIRITWTADLSVIESKNFEYMLIDLKSYKC